MGSSEVKGDLVLRWRERKRVALMPSSDAEMRAIEAGRTRSKIVPEPVSAE